MRSSLEKVAKARLQKIEALQPWRARINMDLQSGKYGRKNRSLLPFTVYSIILSQTNHTLNDGCFQISRNFSWRCFFIGRTWTFDISWRGRCIFTMYTASWRKRLNELTVSFLIVWFVWIMWIGINASAQTTQHTIFEQFRSKCVSNE